MVRPARLTTRDAPETEALAPTRTGSNGGTSGNPRRKRVTQRTIAVLPTLFTLGNLLAGFGAIFAASRPADTPLPFGWSPLTLAALLVMLGMVLDGLDGRIARLTRSFSDLGEQLDSMADMVSFGVAPAFIVVQAAAVQTPFLAENPDMDTMFDRFGLLVAAAYVACAGLRLARFNVELNRDAPEEIPDASEANPNENQDDESESEVAKHLAFRGLPSPGAAGAVATLALLHQYFLHLPDADPSLPTREGAAFGAALVLIAATLLCALAMVSRLKYVHILNRYVRGRAPFGVVALAVVVGLLLLVWPQVTAAAGFLAYAVSAPAGEISRRLKPRVRR
ncbi:MAG: phosphatidylcholine/phosphatidylserine synthase [Planctomycetota bacterium]